MRRLGLALLLMPTLAAGARAADLVTLATLAVTGALDPLSQEFQRESGHTIRITYDTGPNMARRTAAGEPGDVLITTTDAIEQAVKDGRVLARPIVPIGRVGVGVAVRRGARVPDVSTADALRQALLDAEAIYYSQGTSGAHVASVFTTLGIADRIRARTQQMPNGGVVMERVIADRRQAVGFTMLTEIQLMVPRGATLAGPLPASLQNHTPYAAAVLAATTEPAAARAFVTFLDTVSARARFRATGWE